VGFPRVFSARRYGALVKFHRILAPPAIFAVVAFGLNVPPAFATTDDDGSVDTGSSSTTPDYNCHEWSDGDYGYIRLVRVINDGGYSRARPYATATKIMLLVRGTDHWSNYWCKNKYGNIWYHLSSYDQDYGYGFAYSGHFTILG
jgi:hypothetical protein